MNKANYLMKCRIGDLKQVNVMIFPNRFSEKLRLEIPNLTGKLFNPITKND